MARAKSLQDIEDQLDRIVSGGASDARNQRAQNAYQRYWENMSRTNQFQQDDAAQQRAFYNGDMSEYSRLDDQLKNRKYSRNTYMGLNAG